jgi:hypothetical protein
VYIRVESCNSNHPGKPRCEVRAGFDHPRPAGPTRASTAARPRAAGGIGQAGLVNSDDDSAAYGAAGGGADPIEPNSAATQCNGVITLREASTGLPPDPQLQVRSAKAEHTYGSMPIDAYPRSIPRNTGRSVAANCGSGRDSRRVRGVRAPQ